MPVFKIKLPANWPSNERHIYGLGVWRRGETRELELDAHTAQVLAAKGFDVVKKGPSGGEEVENAE